MDSKENWKEKSEKAAIKSLIEISQKENYYDSGNSDNELDAWVYSKIDKKDKTKVSNAKPLAPRPSTAAGKPPRVTSRPESRSSKDHQSRDFMVKRICIVAPTCHSNSMKPPVLNRFAPRSSSLKNDQDYSKASFERNLTNDINFNYRRKMIKYRLCKDTIEKDKREGLSLITFPKVVL